MDICEPKNYIFREIFISLTHLFFKYTFYYIEILDEGDSDSNTDQDAGSSEEEEEEEEEDGEEDEEGKYINL